jgi:hypothetical protein
MPLGADIVPISITQQVSVSGYALACDPLCQEYGIGLPDSGQTFSSSATNSDLPPTNPSVTGQATDFDADTNYSRTASVQANVNQSSLSLTPNNIQVDLYAYDLFSGNDTLQAGIADAYSQYLLTFDLNNPSLVHLTGSFDGETSFSQGFLSGSFNGEILLTGPGAPFDQSVSTDIFFLPQGFDTSIVLGAGVYTLDVVSELDVEETYFLDCFSGFDVSLDADFAAIPEPKRLSPVLGLLMLTGFYFFRKHHQRSPLATAGSARRSVS